VAVTGFRYSIAMSRTVAPIVEKDSTLSKDVITATKA
jgi:hypothetical protein